MSQPTEQGASPEGTAPARPGKKAGQATEFTVFAPLKPGGADMIREAIKTHWRSDAEDRQDPVGTLHYLRIVFFNDETMMLFATEFDGDWENYINDFASKLVF